MERQPKREVSLKDRYSGNLVWLTVRDGVVVGAMGSDPKRYLGMTLDAAKHYARYGGKPLKLPSHAHATKRKTMADYDAEGYAAKTSFAQDLRERTRELSGAAREKIHALTQRRGTKKEA